MKKGQLHYGEWPIYVDIRGACQFTILIYFGFSISHNYLYHFHEVKKSI